MTVPCSLCFVEDDNTFCRRARVLQTLISKVMDVLNESHGLPMRFGFADLVLSLRALDNFVSGQCFLQYAHKRSVAREENGVLNETTGQRFRSEILSVGGARPALESFVAFRGREPNIDALLRHSGMLEAA